jgi:hypothetical protein
MVDYRKWDKIDYGDSDDEKEEIRNKQPQVTTLPRDGGGRVTIGPQGYSIHDEAMEEGDDEPSSLPSFAEVNRTILENERKKLSTEQLTNEDRVDEDIADDKRRGEYDGEMIDEEEEEEKEFYEMQKQLYLRKEFEENETKRIAEKLSQENKPVSSSSISSSSSSSSSASSQPASKSKSTVDRTKNGSKGFYRNDSLNSPFYEWSQNRTEVNLYLYFPFDLFLNILSSSSSPSNSLQEGDLMKMKKKDFSVVYEEKEEGNRLFTIYYRGSSIKDKEKQQQKDNNSLSIFSAFFLYDIEVTGESDNPYDDIIDWNFTTGTLPVEAQEARTKQGSNLKNMNCFLFEFLIKKKVKIANAILWWKTVFQGETNEVDVNTITERSKNYSEFLNNFQIANEEFLKKVKNFEKTSVDI